MSRIIKGLFEEEVESCMKEKVLLISIMLYSQYSNSGIDHIAGFLRLNGYTTDIEYFHEDNSLEEIVDTISYDYTSFGIYVDIANVDRCIALANHIKTQTASLIWFGGAYVASCYKNLLEDCQGVDYIVLGSGEMPVLHLLKHRVASKMAENPYVVSRISTTGKRYNENTVLEYPFAEDYFIRNFEKAALCTHCIQSKSNTCGGNCTFCINWCIERERLNFRYRSTEAILGEIQRMYSAYGVRHFFFVDDDLLDPGTQTAKDRIAELCTAIINSGMQITMAGYIKANTLTECSEDEKLLDLMYCAGFVSLFVGIESGCSRDLLLFGKQATVEDNERIIPLLYKHNIKPDYEMIMFHPYTTVNSLKENFKFLTRVQSHNFRHYVMAGVSIYQNTKLWHQAQKDGLLARDYTYKNPDRYDFQKAEISEFVYFLKEHFEENDEINTLVTADRLISIYYQFARYVKSVRSLGEIVKKVQKDNFELMQFIFEPLFMRCDYNECMQRFDMFVEEYKKQADIIQKLINKILKLKMLDGK